jgi:hypothetical protein
MSACTTTLIQNHFDSYQRKSKHSSHHHYSYPKTTNATTSNNNDTQSIKIQTEKLRQDLIQNFIILQTSNLSLNSNSNNNDDDNNDNDDNINYKNQISNTLINIINSVFSTIVSSPSSSKLTTQNAFSKSEYYESSITILEYIASFVCNCSTKGDESFIRIVLDHMNKFASLMNYESIRWLVCSFVGWCSTHLLECDSMSVISRSMKSNRKSIAHEKDMSASTSTSTSTSTTSLEFLTGYNGNDSNEYNINQEWKIECIEYIISNFLIKRLCDKNQIVRNVTIHSSCVLVSSILDMMSVRNMNSEEDTFEDSDEDDDNNDDDDNDDDDDNEHDDEIVQMLNLLLDALKWNMAHDPSYANRSMVLQSLPIDKLMSMTVTNIFFS